MADTSSSSNAGNATVIGAVASAADSIGSSIINQMFAKRNARLQFKYWNRMRDRLEWYESPTQQLQRLYDANINPLYNSEYSGSATSPGTIGSLPTGVQDSQFSSNLADFLELMLKEREVHVGESRVDAQNAADYGRASEAAANAKLTEVKTTAEIPRAVAEIKALNSQANLNDKDREYKNALISNTLTQAAVSWQQMLQGWDAAQRDWQRLDQEWFTSNWQKNVSYMNATTDRINAQTRQGELIETSLHNRNSERLQAFNAQSTRKQVELAQSQFQWQIKQDNWSAVEQTIKTCQHSVFGVKWAKAKDINRVLGVYGAISQISPEQLQKMPDNIGISMLDFLGLATTALAGAGFIKAGAGVAGKAAGTKFARKYIDKVPRIHIQGFNVE